MRGSGLQWRLLRAFLWPTAAVAAFAAGQGICSAVLPAALHASDDQARPAARVRAVDPQVARVRHLVRSHGCWSGPAPADMRDRIPAHAVVTLPRHRAQYLSSDVGFAIWTGKRAGTLHAFCR